MEKEIMPLLDGLLYPSESDEPVQYINIHYEGSLPIALSKVLDILSLDSSTKIVERDPSLFWANIITIQDWYENSEKERTTKFIQIKQVLDLELVSVQFFEIGKVEVMLLYIGLLEGNLIGLKTMAVRT